MTDSMRFKVKEMLRMLRVKEWRKGVVGQDELCPVACALPVSPPHSGEETSQLSHSRDAHSTRMEEDLYPVRLYSKCFTELAWQWFFDQDNASSSGGISSAALSAIDRIHRKVAILQHQMTMVETAYNQMLSAADGYRDFALAIHDELKEDTEQLDLYISIGRNHGLFTTASLCPCVRPTQNSCKFRHFHTLPIYWWIIKSIPTIRYSSE